MDSSALPLRCDRKFAWHCLLWVARLAGLAAIVPLMLIVFGESGAGPQGLRAWVYLALFPFGFSAGYLLALRWPVFGGALSLACMVASQIVLGRTFGLEPYLVWTVLSLPAVLLIVAGRKVR
jgi:hypothetical protein